MSAHLPVGSNLFEDRIRMLLRRIGYTNDPDFLSTSDDLGVSQTRLAVEAAFRNMGVIGAFSPRSHLAGGKKTTIPVLYVVVAPTEEKANAYHRAIWSQSLVPLVLILSPFGFQIRNGFDYRGGRGIQIPWTELDNDQLPSSLSALRPETLRSATSWRDFGISAKGRIDNRLHSDIRALSIWIQKSSPKLNGRANTINSLIGRFLYLFVLIDRGLIDQSWVDSLKLKGKPLCPEIRLVDDGLVRTIWPASQVWALFDAVDAVLNGSVFPLTDEEREILPENILDVVRRVLRSDRLDGGGHQLGFIDVDYATIRTETISIIYELFFELEEASSKDDDAAFYTPPFLVDYMLDEIDALRTLTADSVVFDPAAGSGAFLVGAFRRIIERERSSGRKLTPHRLRKLLVRSIYGMEIKQQAVNVARFGLYLTMLDYLPNANLRSLTKELKNERLFPAMQDNLRTRDTFLKLPRDFANKATHVLGNPPWSRAKSGTPAMDYHDAISVNRPVTRTSLAELFFWRSVDDIAAPDALVAMVMPTKSLIAPKATHFPTAIMESVQIHGLTNLAHLRRRLFVHAEAPATVIFASSRAPDALGWTWRYSPLLANQPLSSDGHPWAIVVDRGNVERSRQIDLCRGDHSLYRLLMLQPLDRRLAAEMESRAAFGKKCTTLAEFMHRAGLVIKRGASPAEANLEKQFLLDSGKNNYLARLGLISGARKDYDLPSHLLQKVPSSYRTLFGGPVLLVPRAQTRYDVVKHSVAFASTLTGIGFTNNKISSKKKVAILSEIAAFMQTQVARYLLALFGRMWVLDERRFESTDLKTLPFPYTSSEELLSNPLSLMSDEEFTDFFREKFDLGEIFAMSVAEHHSLREAYQNGKIPPPVVAFPVEDKTLTVYLSTVVSQFDKILGGAGSIAFQDRRRRGSSIDVLLSVRTQASDNTQLTVPDWPQELTDLGEQGAISVITSHPEALISVSKPDVRGAWTIERAYVDAENIARRLLSPSLP